MENALARTDIHEIPSAPGAPDAALRLALEEARRLAAQSRLLALNAALEAAGACREAEGADEAASLGAAAGAALDEAERIAAAVDLMLQQIQSAATLTRSL